MYDPIVNTFSISKLYAHNKTIKFPFSSIYEVHIAISGSDKIHWYSKHILNQIESTVSEPDNFINDIHSRS